MLRALTTRQHLETRARPPYFPGVELGERLHGVTIGKLWSALPFQGLEVLGMSPCFKRKATHRSGHHKTIKREQHQRFCEGCDEEVILLVQQWTKYLAGGPSGREPKPRAIEDSFGDLERCAANGCVSCRVFRRASLLAQITTQQAELLRGSKGPVFVSGMQRKGTKAGNLSEQFDLVISIGEPSKSKYIAKVACTKNVNLDYLNLPLQYCNTTREHKNPADGHSMCHNRSQTFADIKSWLDYCHEQHDGCDRLRWAGKKDKKVRQNPAHLIEILPDGEHLRLVESKNREAIDYVALSYSWGDRIAMGGTQRPFNREWQQVDNGKTTTGNVDRRKKQFALQELPATMQDAVIITRHLGLSHLWTDNVCIGKLSKSWNHEAFRMHEVYSNAYVTLCACSTTKATEHLLQPREAWRYRAERCEVAQFSIVEYDMNMTKIRLEAPVFSRGWVLQEERLSPRIIYWCGQRVYWSCTESNLSEGQQPPELKQTNIAPDYRFYDEGGLPKLPGPQNFLSTLRSPDSGPYERHQQWLELVQTYTRKTLSEKTDKLAAISGPAAQYLTSHSPPALKGQLYLAGLWKSTLPKDLAFSVMRPQNPKDNQRSIAPSWSWASLPFATETQVIREDFCSTKCLALTKAFYNESEESDPIQTSEGRGTNEPDVLKMVIAGSECKGLQVRGCMRPLTACNAKKVCWSEIKAKSGKANDFNLRNYLSTAIYARNHDLGLILASEAHRGQVVGQLDYFDPSSKLSACLQHSQVCHLLDGEERDLMCLELSTSALLLLQKLKIDEERVFNDTNGLKAIEVYRRVGLSTQFPKDFFEGAHMREAVLV